MYLDYLLCIDACIFSSYVHFITDYFNKSITLCYLQLCYLKLSFLRFSLNATIMNVRTVNRVLHVLTKMMRKELMELLEKKTYIQSVL